MKILSLDGGGVFGVLQAAVLARARRLDKIDMIVGTSIGSANGALLAIGKKPSVDFFNEWMPKVFKRKRLFSTLFCPMYGDKALNSALMTNLGGYMLGDVKTPFFACAFDSANNNLKVFSSLNNDDASTPLWEVVRASTAAPLYFRSYNGYVDGGIVANNPSFIGVAGAISKMKAKLEDIEVFSISCGDPPSSSSQPASRLIPIAKWIIPALLGGASDRMHDFFARAMPIKSYQRVSFSWEPDWKMDGVKGMKEAQSKLAPQIMRATDELNSFLER